MKRAIFLDRDGVLIERAPVGAYVISPSQVCLHRGVAEAVRSLHESGFLVIVVTNQAGIGKGLMSDDDLRQIHAKMQESLASGGAFLTAILFCPHRAEAGCTCRKPAPGMLQKASQEYGVDLSRSWMVGDSISDVEAGQRAGCKTILITDQERGAQTLGVADFAAGSLTEAARRILSCEPCSEVGQGLGGGASGMPAAVRTLS